MTPARLLTHEASTVGGEIHVPWTHRSSHPCSTGKLWYPQPCSMEVLSVLP